MHITITADLPNVCGRYRTVADMVFCVDNMVVADIDVIRTESSFKCVKDSQCLQRVIDKVKQWCGEWLLP